jgi:hypothetical protein
MQQPRLLLNTNTHTHSHRASVRRNPRRVEVRCFVISGASLESVHTCAATCLPDSGIRRRRELEITIYLWYDTLKKNGTSYHSVGECQPQPSKARALSSFASSISPSLV